MMIIYIAGLQSIPSDYIEAAKVDGATAWQTFWKVKIPNLMPTITICLFLSITNGFKLFDQNLALTGGAPHTPPRCSRPEHLQHVLLACRHRMARALARPRQSSSVSWSLLFPMIQLKATRVKEVQQ